MNLLLFANKDENDANAVNMSVTVNRMMYVNDQLHQNTAFLFFVFVIVIVIVLLLLLLLLLFIVTFTHTHTHTHTYYVRKRQIGE